MLREKKPCCLTVIGVSETLQWGRVTHMQARPYPTSSFIWTQERIQTTIFRHGRTQLLTPVLTLQSPFCKSTHNISGLCKRGGLSPTCARSEGLPLKSDAVLKSWHWVAMAASWEECHVCVLPTLINIGIKMTNLKIKDWPYKIDHKWMFVKRANVFEVIKLAATVPNRYPRHFARQWRWTLDVKKFSLKLRIRIWKKPK